MSCWADAVGSPQDGEAERGALPVSVGADEFDLVAGGVGLRAGIVSAGPVVAGVDIGVAPFAPPVHPQGWARPGVDGDVGAVLVAVGA